MTRDEVVHLVERELGVRIEAMHAVGGGCVSPAWRAMSVDDGVMFIKAAPGGAPAGLLEAERKSLERLAATGAVRVPSVIGGGPGWLALEWLEPAPPRADAWRALGQDLARLHRHGAAGYGWEDPNFIGPLPQSNEPDGHWPAFWRERRLLPQLEAARGCMGAAAAECCERVLDALDGLLAPARHDGASLLHGDLWSGNVHFTDSGGALIDPSSYYGHREVDLAMAALFGGFPPAFFDAYDAEWPLLPGAAARRPVYQLYYLLVHVNLFGSAYIAQTRRAAEAALSAAR